MPMYTNSVDAVAFAMHAVGGKTGVRLNMQKKSCYDWHVRALSA